jgi:hypothetical protein
MWGIVVTSVPIIMWDKSGNMHAADSFTDSPSRNTRKQSNMVADSGMATRKKGMQK